MLNWEKIPDKEKVKVMNKMINYCKKQATSIYDKYNPNDLYSVCKTMGATTFFDFLQNFCDEED